MSAQRFFRVGMREPGGLREKLAADRAQRAAERDARDAHAYRLMQAEEILREAGCVPQGDGTWLPPDR